MVLLDLEVAIDFRFFMVALIEVDPRYHRIELLVAADQIANPDMVVIGTELYHYWQDREEPWGGGSTQRCVDEKDYEAVRASC